MAGGDSSVSEVADRCGCQAVLVDTNIGLHETEVVHHNGPWRRARIVKIATLRWVRWLNHDRPLNAISCTLPALYVQM
jgi:hypothetical protein